MRNIQGHFLSLLPGESFQAVAEPGILPELRKQSWESRGAKQVTVHIIKYGRGERFTERESTQDIFIRSSSSDLLSTGPLVQVKITLKVSTQDQRKITLKNQRKNFLNYHTKSTIHKRKKIDWTLPQLRTSILQKH